MSVVSPSADPLRDKIAALFRSPLGGPRLEDETPGEIADAVLTVVSPELEQLRAQLRHRDRKIGRLTDERNTALGRAETAESEAASLRWRLQNFLDEPS